MSQLYKHLTKIKNRYSGTELFMVWYRFYLLTSEWKALRVKVIEREKNICECCQVFGIENIHHLTYKNVGREKLEDLEGLCGWCHTFIHDKFPKNFKDLVKGIE